MDKKVKEIGRALRWVVLSLGGIDQEKGFPRTAAFYCLGGADALDSLCAKIDYIDNSIKAEGAPDIDFLIAAYRVLKAKVNQLHDSLVEISGEE